MTIKKKAIVKKSSSVKDGSTQLDFASLVKAIHQVHEESASFVNRTVNTAVTVRNWIIGAYIVEFGSSAPIVRSVTAQLAVPAEKLLNSLSFTHLEQLIAIDDPLKRAFYEIECIRGNWSVRALKRQIATLYFERSGLSKDKEKLAAMVKKGVDTAEPKLTIRDPYIFEFLGLMAI